MCQDESYRGRSVTKTLTQISVISLITYLILITILAILGLQMIPVIFSEYVSWIPRFPILLSIIISLIIGWLTQEKVWSTLEIIADDFHFYPVAEYIHDMDDHIMKIMLFASSIALGILSYSKMFSIRGHITEIEEYSIAILYKEKIYELILIVFIDISTAFMVVLSLSSILLVISTTAVHIRYNIKKIKWCQFDRSNQVIQRFVNAVRGIPKHVKPHHKISHNSFKATTIRRHSISIGRYGSDFLTKSGFTGLMTSLICFFIGFTSYLFSLYILSVHDFQILQLFSGHELSAPPVVFLVAESMRISGLVVVWFSGIIAIDSYNTVKKRMALGTTINKIKRLRHELDNTTTSLIDKSFGIGNGKTLSYWSKWVRTFQAVQYLSLGFGYAEIVVPKLYVPALVVALVLQTTVVLLEMMRIHEKLTWREWILAAGILSLPFIGGFYYIVKRY